MKFGTTTISVALFALCCVGCQNTASGMEKDAQINQQKATQVAEKTAGDMKEVGKDVKAAVTLTPFIKTAFEKEPLLKDEMSTIDVDSTDSLVTLKGMVRTAEARDRATAVANEIVKEKGQGQKLVNELKVKA